MSKPVNREKRVEKDLAYPAAIWYHKIYNQLFSLLQEEKSCQAYTRQLLETYLGCTLLDHVVGRNLSLSGERYILLQKDIQKLGSHIPIQYVLGYADFLGYRFSVTPDVLIPREETAEMVAFIAKADVGSKPKVLDLGSGSGCIAIALAKRLPGSQVTGIDISLSALAVAKENAKKMEVKVRWRQGDMLHLNLEREIFDIIVSNPPYVPRREAKSLSLHVLKEPAQALFVPDDNPLLFYEAIARIAKKHLAQKGGLYTEVHAPYASSVAKLYESTGFAVAIEKDLHGKLRWVKAGFAES